VPLKSNGRHTKHEQRNDHIRARIKTLLHRMRFLGLSTQDAEKRFRDTSLRISKERELRFYKKDKDTALRPFLLGKQDVYTWALDVYEYACIELERELRETQSERQTPPAPPELEKVIAEVTDLGLPPLRGDHDKVTPPKQPKLTLSDDPEISAIGAVITALEPLQQAARARVVKYVQERFHAGDLWKENGE
jgi:hypothetical protein